MKEKRQYERFNIPLHVRLETMGSGSKEVLEYKTGDISTSGAFIPSLKSLPEGTRFILDFTIPSDGIKEFKYVKSLKGSKGTLVRSNSKGIAVHFDRDCYIVSINSKHPN
jgi:hypothetical protein